MKRFALVVLLLCGAVLTVVAQPTIPFIKVEVRPDHTDWLYSCGEKPQFAVEVTTCSNAPVENVEVRYEVSEDMLPPLAKGKMVLRDGKTVIKGYTMRKPGFLRCRIWATVDGKTYEECATAGFDVDKIKATTTMPDDFEQFWRKALAENEQIELLPQLTLLPEHSTSKVDVYLAKFQNFRQGSYIYGTMCVPKQRTGKCPAILIVPGAGCRARTGYMEEAEKGVVTLEVGIHGIPTTMFGSTLYKEMYRSTLYRYWLHSIDDKDNYVYKRIFLGCARAIDFLAQLDFVDAERIAVTGGSQGGALTIVTSYLNPRVKFAAAIYPAMCDLTGHLHNQGNAWPYIFTNKSLATPQRLETAKYYDVVNFARLMRQPIFFTFGYNDMVVCPTSMYAGYNAVTSPKELMPVPQSRHYTYPEQKEARSKWLLERLLK